MRYHTGATPFEVATGTKRGDLWNFEWSPRWMAENNVKASVFVFRSISLEISHKVKLEWFLECLTSTTHWSLILQIQWSLLKSCYESSKCCLVRWAENAWNLSENFGRGPYGGFSSWIQRMPPLTPSTIPLTLPCQIPVVDLCHHASWWLLHQHILQCMSKVQMGRNDLKSKWNCEHTCVLTVIGPPFNVGA